MPKIKLYPAKDIYHQTVRKALEADGWTITHDPYFLRLGKRKGYIDLGAEMICAEKESEHIAVEIKSFVGLSEVDEFEDALGQFLVYKLALHKKEPERILFLALPDGFYETFFDDPFFLEVLETYNVKIITFDEIKNCIVKWIK